jgi:hypothetical protein
MPTNTYNAIETTTLASTATSFTFATIPQTYQNLVVVTNTTAASGTAGRTALRFNGDSGANYHHAQFGASNTTWGPEQDDSITYAMTGYYNNANSLQVTEVMGYKSTDFNKNVLSRFGDNYPEVGMMASTWRNTAAITSIQVICLGVFPVGTIITLYGLVGA